jgi:branched-chain amino acid aminotransferase
MQYTIVNGALVPSANAVLPVADRGFRFGDAVFETVRVIDATPRCWAFHRQRLEAGLAALRIGFDTVGLYAACMELTAANGLRDGLLRIAVSRGSGSRGYLPLPGIVPSWIIETMPLPEAQPPAALWLSGYEKPSPRALPVRHKLAQGVNATLARLEAADHACDDALLLNAQGHICESTSANLFWLTDGTLHTPALECGVLDGTIRHLLLAHSPYPVMEGMYAPEALQAAQAVVLTNVAFLALPVASLAPQGWGWKSNALALELRALVLAVMQRESS